MKIILNGAGGRMGKAVCLQAESGSRDDSICAKIDKISPDIQLKSVSEYTEEADVIIDFSHHSATKELTDYAVSRNLPIVICTTGQTDEDLELIRNASESVPVFFSANMSLGIAVLYNFARRAAELFPDADIEIVEAHHNRKLDAPSGTAKLLCDGICSVRPDAKPVYGRHGMAKREKNEIGMHSLRMGNETGMHEVLISTDHQTLSLKHNAHSREVFAEGAISAARFICGKPAGLYDMQSILGK